MWQDQGAGPRMVRYGVDLDTDLFDTNPVDNPFGVMSQFGLPNLRTLVLVTGKVEERENGDRC